jgi:hypothetical protein
LIVARSREFSGSKSKALAMAWPTQASPACTLARQRLPSGRPSLMIFWTRKHWPGARSDDELWLNPTDHGATVLIGGRVLGYEVCGDERVPPGKALVYCKALSAYVGDGQMPDARFVLMRLPEGLF